MTKQTGMEEKEVYTEVSNELIAILNAASTETFKPKLLKDTANVTIKAAAACCSIHAARKRMKQGKSRRRIAYVLGGLDLEKLQKKVTEELKIDAKKFRGTDQVIAIDTHLIAYHGDAHQSDDEISRNKQKDGTTHFHAFATAYVVDTQGRRYAIAIMFVRKGTSVRTIVPVFIET